MTPKPPPLPNTKKARLVWVILDADTREFYDLQPTWAKAIDAAAEIEADANLKVKVVARELR